MTNHITPLPANPFMVREPEILQQPNPSPMPTAIRAGLIPAFERFDLDYPMLARYDFLWRR